MYPLDLGVTSGKRKIVNHLSRTTTTRRTQSLFTRKMEKIKQRLKDIKYVCTTADIWSGNKRSFFGVTAHWVKISNAKLDLF